MKNRNVRKLRSTPTLYTGILIAVIGSGLGIVGGCKDHRPVYCQGYFEADYIYCSAPVAGRLTNLAARRGTQVQSGQLLFELDPEPEAYQLKQAQATSAQADDLLADSRKGLRPDEMDARRAAVAQRQALSSQSGLEAERLQQVRVDKMVSENEYDRARLQHQANLAAEQQALANLRQARLGARIDQIHAQENAVQALQAAQQTAAWKLAQKMQSAPQDGLIYDTYFREGEWVPAGQPVSALLPPDHLKILFYAKEEVVSQIHIDQMVYFTSPFSITSNCARVTFISPNPEYTPPVIFSRDTNAKLVYRIEAYPEPVSPDTMHPGQPVSVFLDRFAIPAR